MYEFLADCLGGIKPPAFTSRRVSAMVVEVVSTATAVLFSFFVFRHLQFLFQVIDGGGGFVSLCRA